MSRATSRERERRSAPPQTEAERRNSGDECQGGDRNPEARRPVAGTSASGGRACLLGRALRPVAAGLLLGRSERKG